MGRTAMNLRALEALRAFVDSGSLSGAAARLHRTQPQISRLLSALEEGTGLRLFERKARRLRLTEQGQEFYFLVQHTLNSFDELARSAERLRAGEDLHVRILTAPHLTGALIAEPLADMMKAHVSFTASVDSRSRIDIDYWVGQEHFDLGVAVLPVTSPLVDAEEFLAAPVVAVMTEEHPLSRNRVVEAEDLGEFPFIATSSRSILRKNVDLVFAELGMKLQPRIETPNGLIACQLAMRGIGVTLADPFVALSAARSGVVFRIFKPMIELKYGFLYPKWKTRSRVTLEFAALIKKNAENKLRQLKSEIYL
jgi:DNA-binding transcriptional LysR family regulator